jgi:suppressor of ftsI
MDSWTKGYKLEAGWTRQMNRNFDKFGQLVCISLLFIVPSDPQSLPPPKNILLAAPPQVRGDFVLRAVTDPVTGKGVFLFDGHGTPPLIRTAPGAKLRVTYINDMSPHSTEICIDRPCMNMTNLHFHGLHVSPQPPQDDVLDMSAMPGESLHYSVDIPANQPPGLYWYHTHPHGESYQQDLDGMSGAIVIDGIDRYVPEVRTIPERVLILRDAELQQGTRTSTLLKRTVDLSPYHCGAASDEPTRIFTLNGSVRPKIPIAPGERQFWRIVNASPDLYADLMVDTESLTVVAFDGMPLGFHDPRKPTESRQHVLLPPAGRVEVIVNGPKRGVPASFRSRCVNTGLDGDPNPAMVLADLDTSQGPEPRPAPLSETSSYNHVTYKQLPARLITQVQTASPQFVVNFTEDKDGFYINGKKYTPADDPMITVDVHWRVVNATHEIHPFHIHQVHFLVYRQSGAAIRRPEWLDTVNVAPMGSVDLVMDFTDPIIRGVSLFHCHLLKHEDKGMMAKILFR